MFPYILFVILFICKIYLSLVFRHIWESYFKDFILWSYLSLHFEAADVPVQMIFPLLLHFSQASNHLIFCHPFLLLPSIFPSIKVFSNEFAYCIRCPKYWNFCFSITPSNEYWGLISFRIDWFDLLAVQGTLKSLLQHHNSKASILQYSALFMVQLLHPYMTTGKNIEWH